MRRWEPRNSWTSAKVKGVVCSSLAVPVYSLAQEEKEGNHSHIHSGLYGRTVGIVGCNAEGMVQQLDGHRFYTVWRGVSFGIGAQLSLDAEVDGAQRVLPDVLGPQAGKRLAHGT